MKGAEDGVKIFEVMGHIDWGLREPPEELDLPRTMFACFPTEKMACDWVQATCDEVRNAAGHEEDATVCADIVEITIPTSIVAELLCRQPRNPVITYSGDVDKLVVRRLLHATRFPVW